jgi:hypothetical protein
MCRWFCQWLDESSTDFRVGAEALKSTSFAVFGCGNSLYEANFNKVLSTRSALSHHTIIRQPIDRRPPGIPTVTCGTLASFQGSTPCMSKRGCRSPVGSCVVLLIALLQMPTTLEKNSFILSTLYVERGLKG